MNGFEQYQYAEMMRQSRNSAIYQMLFARQGVAGGDGKESEPPVPPEPPAQLSTYMEFDDGTSQWFDFSGEISQQTMVDEGLFDLDNYEWIKNLTKVEIGSKVTSIGEGVFSDCSGLTSITIPNSVTSIGNYAFSGCSGLTSLTIPNSVTSIGNWALDHCSRLTSIEIPNSVTSIGEGAFSDCTGLTSITIPNSVTSIGEGAFSDCTGLTSVTIEGKSQATVQGMDNYSWDLQSGCTISGTDPDTEEPWEIIL